MSDLNDRIAKAKGWTLYTATGKWHGPPRIWADPDGYPRMHPDFTGTLEGVAGMLRELNEREEAPVYWTWGYCPLEETIPASPCYIVVRHCGQVHSMVEAHSDPDRPGDCVGDAYMSVLGKEAG